MKKIYISGLLAYDKILNYPGVFSDHIMPDKLHTLSVSFVADDMQEHFGGTAGNIAYSLAMLGEKPVVLSAAGKDFGPYRQHMQKIGADLRYVRMVPNKPTAQVTIMTDQRDNQIAGVYLGTMAYESLFKAGDAAQKAWAVIAPGNVREMCRLAKLYKSKKIPYIFDPGQQIPQMSAEQLRSCIQGSQLLISNDYELSLILKKMGLAEMKLSQNLITTLGEKGSRLNGTAIPAAKVKKVLDPTGAGDAYRAGLLKGILAGWPLEMACKFAGVISAYAIEAHGPQGHTLTFEQAKKRYRQNFGDTLR